MSAPPIPCLAFVAEDFEGEEGELTLSEGTKVVVVKCDDDGWWTVHTKELGIGIFPGSYLDVKEHIKLPCTAKINKFFKDLNLQAGEIVQVQEISEEGWMIECKSNLGFCTWDYLDIVKEVPQQQQQQQRPPMQGGAQSGGGQMQQQQQQQQRPPMQGGAPGGGQMQGGAAPQNQQQRPISQAGGPMQGGPMGGPQNQQPRPMNNQPGGPIQGGGAMGGPGGGGAPQNQQPRQMNQQGAPIQGGGGGPIQGGAPQNQQQRPVSQMSPNQQRPPIQGGAPGGGGIGGGGGPGPNQLTRPMSQSGGMVSQNQPRPGGAPQGMPSPQRAVSQASVMPNNAGGAPQNQQPRPVSQMNNPQPQNQPRPISQPTQPRPGGPQGQPSGNQQPRPATQLSNQPPQKAAPKPGGPPSGPSKAPSGNSNAQNKKSILNLPDPEYRFSGFTINSEFSDLTGRKEDIYDPYLMPNQRNAPKFEQDGRWEFRALRDLPPPPPFQDVPKEYVSGSMASFIDWKAKERSAVFDI